MSTEVKPKKSNIGKIILIIIGIFLLLIIIGAIAGGNKSSNTDSVTKDSTTDTAAQATTPQKPKDVLVLSKATFNDKGYGYYEVLGEATNNDTVSHTANVTATFYNASGAILGTAIGTVNDLAPGQTKTYTLFGGDKVAGYTEIKVQVSTLL